MTTESLLRLGIIFLCVVFANQVVKQRSKEMARLSATLRIPARALELILAIVVAVPTAYIAVTLLSALGLSLE